MGGDPAYKKAVKECVPDAFHPVGNGNQEMEHIDPIFHVPNGYVVFNDYLIFFNKLVQGSRGKRTFTPKEVFDHFWSNVEQHLCNEDTTCATYIMCTDDKRKVPSAKAATQKKRILAAEQAAERRREEQGEDEEEEEDQFYPAGCTLVEGGVQFPDGHVERIDLYRLSRSCHHTHGKINGDTEQRSNLRSDLWEMFLPYIDMEVQVSLPKGRSFVFSFKYEGPWHFVKGHPPKQLPTLAHCLGEADLAAVYWRHRFAAPPPNQKLPVCAMDFHLKSSDGDFMALFMRDSEFPAPPHATGKVYWHCDPGELVCDLQVLRAGLYSVPPPPIVYTARGYQVDGVTVRCNDKLAAYLSSCMAQREADSYTFESPEHAILGFIYSGMDYKFKKYYAAWFGCEAICEAVKRVKPSVIKRKFDELLALQADEAKWNTYRVNRLKALGGVHVDFLNPTERCTPTHWLQLYEEAFLLELYDTKSDRARVASPPLSSKDVGAPSTIGSLPWTMHCLERMKKQGPLRFVFLGANSKPAKKTFLVEFVNAQSGEVRLATVAKAMVPAQELSIPKMRKHAELRGLVTIQFPSDEEIVHQAEWTKWIWDYWGNARRGIEAPPKPLISDYLEAERARNKAREDARKKETKDKALAKKTAMAGGGIPTPKQIRPAKQRALATPVTEAVKMEVDEQTRVEQAVVKLKGAGSYIRQPLELIQRAKQNNLSAYQQFRLDLETRSREGYLNKLGVATPLASPSWDEEQKFNADFGSVLAAVGFFDRSIFQVKPEQDVEMKL